MRSRNPERLRCAAAAAGVAVAVALAWSAGSARAEDANDDENVPLDTKLFRQFMKDLGLSRSGDGLIEYRERAPLVVPPSRELPPPRDEADVSKTPAWPKDPDVARRKQDLSAEKARLKGNLSVEEQARALRPDELDKPGAGEKKSADAKGAGKSPEDTSRPLMPSDLCTTTDKLLGSIWSSFTPAKPESAPFTGEPPREGMTAPPSGYQPPSPNYHYGSGLHDH